VPPETFKHSNTKASISLDAKLANGASLPRWLTFQPGKNRFVGTPPRGQASLTVMLIARDSSGGEAFTKIRLNFK
jgi:hypothetical protein